MPDTLSVNQLTPAQQSFAQLKRVASARRADLGVFLYSDSPWATYRWLVSPDGRTIDAATFRKSPSSDRS
jgi:hypothetical protein